MKMATIYGNPSDHPGKFVVRLWDSLDGKPEPSLAAFVYDTLEDARRAVPRKFSFRMDRAPSDDPVIVETWL